MTAATMSPTHRGQPSSQFFHILPSRYRLMPAMSSRARRQLSVADRKGSRSVEHNQITRTLGAV